VLTGRSQRYFPVRLAITSLGAAACWGNNFGGEVGDGTAGNQRFEPVWWNPEACSMARH
jgi:hypothetical protein